VLDEDARYIFEDEYENDDEYDSTIWQRRLKRVGPQDSRFGPTLKIGKMSIFNKDFGSLMPSLSLTLNVEP
jgi:hypothetical protein